ncbi:EF-P 5-aminopentanol modification-associated protein YfmF [Levilactobacillus bambusae]|uniref:Insulinase family protein n=1 Tax=Levilactobacillus bambusae TaxID=2024736 RepID=A0A2V1MZQ3_9LACO|nr:pitrilysin family protein [Levilactobacillus bambusae]PWF99569.1 insulinase family protein [Levilactobacillus bambusae]
MHQILKPGVTLDVIPTNQFKTITIMIDFVAPLTVKSATNRALLGELLDTSSEKYPTQTALARQLSLLYGASLGVNVLKAGTKHLVRVTLSTVNDRYLSDEAQHPLFQQGLDLLSEILFHPLIQNGQFDPETFNRQKNNLAAGIRSLSDDKQYEANQHMRQLLFEHHPEQAVGAFGDDQLLEMVTNSELVEDYRTMLTHDAIHIAVIGDVDEQQMVEQMARLPFLPRKTDELESPYFRWGDRQLIEGDEWQDLTQAKFNQAYRLPVYATDDDHAAALVFNAVFGGSPLSLLFNNVREKASLAYYASSNYSGYTGMMTVQTGIKAEDVDQVKAIIAEQLQLIRDGRVESETLGQVQASLVNARLSGLDSPKHRLSARLSADLTGASTPLSEWIDRINAVTIADLQRVANDVHLTAEYFLHGGEK